jgi:hypothetical protein
MNNESEDNSSCFEKFLLYQSRKDKLENATDGEGPWNSSKDKDDFNTEIEAPEEPMDLIADITSIVDNNRR